MFRTIAIPVAAGMAQALNTYLGWRMTISNVSLPQKQKRRYEAVFIVAGVIGVVMIGLGAYYSGPVEKAHFRVVPDLTYRGADQPSWQRPNEFLIVDKPIAFNLDFTNVGGGPAVNFWAFGRAYLEPDESVQSVSLAGRGASLDS